MRAWEPNTETSFEIRYDKYKLDRHETCLPIKRSDDRLISHVNVAKIIFDKFYLYYQRLYSLKS